MGIAVTVPEGTEPSSSAACMSILGYDPVRDYIGRGAIEAAAMGIELAEGDVALRLNLVTIEDGRMASYSAGHITSEESHALISELQDALESDAGRLYPGVNYRHILVVRGAAELAEASFTPPHDISGQPVEGKTPAGPGTKVLLRLMEEARPVLARSPVNADRAARGLPQATDVWPFWPGLRPEGLESFERKRGLRAAMTSGVDLLGGLAELTGMTRLAIPGVTDGPDNDYDAQAEGALAALDEHDLVVIHIESPDEAGHAGDAAAKIAAIEAIDDRVVRRVIERAKAEPLRVLAMPDHPTPIQLKTHVGEPVPFVLWGEGVDALPGASFCERDAAATGLTVDPGRGVMDLLLDGSRVVRSDA
ncbi:MAG: cofactor-independent phosphoglycerate mutase [Coriobacteriia bacterium]